MKVYLLLVCSFISFVSIAQNDRGQLTGNFQSRSQFYDRDDKIGANTTQYLREKSSNESFLYLNYKISGFTFDVRYDLFTNSPLLNPQAAYTNSGIGYYSINKTIGDLEITGGYFYDQFGTGMAFRAFQDINIGIDYAIQGVRAKYKLGNYNLKAFTGVQKGFLDLSTGEDTRFKTTPQNISGINGERTFALTDKINLNTGLGVVKRTLDQSTLNSVANEINSYNLENRFIPRYNTYSFVAHTGINFTSGFSGYFEYSYKTHEAIRDPFVATLSDGVGQVYFTSLSYSTKGLGINVQARRIDNYQFRTSPNYLTLNGAVSYLPALTRSNSNRILARYNPIAQVNGENGIQADIIYSPNKKTTFTANYSYVSQPNGEILFSEKYFDVSHKINKDLKATVGLQSVFYNQRVYELNPNAPNVKTITPFVDVSYKLKNKRSIHLEAQYLSTQADLGSFVNVVVEYSVAPKWSFAIGDMYNTNPVRTEGTPQEVVSADKIHYYSAFTSYTKGTSRFTLAYIKQVQGVNCTGGICRIEPAFSGIRFELSTTF